MIFKNLFRRKGRTILTLLGISIGVAAIVALGAVARGLKAGFAAMTQGSQADIDFSLSSELAEDMSDLRVLQEMVGQISFLAIFIGGVGMLNTML